jgi:acyl carrier protein
MTPEADDRLRAVLGERLGYQLDGREIAPETPLMGQGLGLSSLDVVALVVALEDTFDVIFEAEEISGLVASFGALRQALDSKLAGRPSHHHR